MRTLIDIQDGLIEDLLRESQARTKKDAIITAIVAYLASKRREKLIALAGTYEFSYTPEDLEKMRSDE